MTITVKMEKDVAVFEYPPGYHEIEEELNGLLDRREAGGISMAGYVRALKDLVARHPWFVDGHAHLGIRLYDQGKIGQALKCHERGYSLGTEVLPAGFEAFIEWRIMENRPFLRAAHGLASCHVRLGHSREAIAVMEKILAWNPNDEQGIRFLIGSEYLRAGQEDEAESFFVTEAAEYPPYHYELALLRLRRGRYVEAATSLRLGFVANGYIAEILCGNPDPAPMGISHWMGFDGPDPAKDYVSSCGRLWHRTRDAIAFLRWLHTHPLVMFERAAVLQWREALLWEYEPERRQKIHEAEIAQVARIDDELSKEIVIDRADREGRMVSCAVERRVFLAGANPAQHCRSGW